MSAEHFISFPLNGDLTDEQIEENTFKAFAWLHPHEAYALDADRFVKFAQDVNPKATREDILRTLQETDEPQPHE
jgi:hypothetical protein